MVRPRVRKGRDKRPDAVLVDLTARVEQWVLKVSDYGEESVNYQNGDSDVFAGDAWQHLAKLKKELRLVLGNRGVELRDQLAAINRRK